MNNNPKQQSKKEKDQEGTTNKEQIKKVCCFVPQYKRNQI